MEFLIILSCLTSLTSCAQFHAFSAAYKTMPDDNVVEESVEWVVEEGVEILTGQDIHLDLSGDSPEERIPGKKQ